MESLPWVTPTQSGLEGLGCGLTCSLVWGWGNRGPKYTVQNKSPPHRHTLALQCQGMFRAKCRAYCCLLSGTWLGEGTPFLSSFCSACSRNRWAVTAENLVT